MLSYQHIYHAGNRADVHKHSLLAWVLDYLTRKDKPLTYIETHAGRGLYDLGAPEALKTGEAAQGIALAEQRRWFGADHPYGRCLAEVRARYGAAAYPGSPLLAVLSLRKGDRMLLAELHPREFATLEAVMARYGAICEKRDGAEMALAATPPTPRRGVMLIDPSYEVKSDYETLPGLIRGVNRRWNVGVIMLWYPILAAALHLPMLAALEASDFPGGLRHEVSFGPAKDGHRMLGSGLFVVNAPFGMAEEADRVGALIGV